MQLLLEDIEYFNRGKYENPKFWSRFDKKPQLKNSTVLDIGCGHGSLCIDMALAGARKIVGLDINSNLINFANKNLSINFPKLKDTIEFKDIDIRDYPNNIAFDYIISKDSFEHIIDLEGIFNEIGKKLKPKGKAYLGFGPLYNSPFGDHGRTKTKIPWGHLIVPESIIIKRLNKIDKSGIVSIQDLGLNKWKLSDYERLFKNSELSIVFFKVNQSNEIVSKLFTLISKIPVFKEYFSHNIYCILEKQ